MQLDMSHVPSTTWKQSDSVRRLQRFYNSKKRDENLFQVKLPLNRAREKPSGKRRCARCMRGNIQY